MKLSESLYAEKDETKERPQRRFGGFIENEWSGRIIKICSEMAISSRTNWSLPLERILLRGDGGSGQELVTFVQSERMQISFKSLDVFESAAYAATPAVAVTSLSTFLEDSGRV
jgi:hypothetical protein